MSEKNSVKVVIDGKVYTLCADEAQDYMQKVASYVNDMIAKYNKSDSFRRLPTNARTTLVQLQLANDYFKVSEQLLELEAASSQKDKDLYDLKHDLSMAQLKAERDQARIRELEREVEILRLKGSI